MAALTFLKTAVRDYRVGALTRSSTYVVDRVRAQVDVSRAYVVEYGPGDGVITRALLAQLPRNGQLIAIERNPEFCAALAAIRDPRLRVVWGDARMPPNAAELGVPRIDAVVSGIPLTLFRPEDRIAIIERTHAVLDDAGIFVVYQYSPLVLPVLARQFADVSVRLEPRNFLPYFIMTARKAESYATTRRW